MYAMIRKFRFDDELCTEQAAKEIRPILKEVFGWAPGWEILYDAKIIAKEMQQFTGRRFDALLTEEVWRARLLGGERRLHTKYQTYVDDVEGSQETESFSTAQDLLPHVGLVYGDVPARYQRPTVLHIGRAAFNIEHIPMFQDFLVRLKIPRINEPFYVRDSDEVMPQRGEVHVYDPWSVTDESSDGEEGDGDVDDKNADQEGSDE